MSRVVQRELFEGDVATAANFNSTLSSWNSAAGAGDIGADNFREEGLDVRSFAVGSVKKPFAATDRFIGGALGGGSFSTTSAVFVNVVMAATTAQIGPFDLSQTNRRLVVHASLFGRMVTAGEVLEVELAQSSDNITYTSIAWTLRALRARVGNTPLAQADIEQSFTIATRIVSISATTYIRLRARTSGGATGTINCVSLFGELYNK
jgi:hypothetical protein